MPDYYTQNFHYQSGGWLTEESARIYDVQVETLFFGAAGAMRRQAIPQLRSSSAAVTSGSSACWMWHAAAAAFWVSLLRPSLPCQ